MLRLVSVVLLDNWCMQDEGRDLSLNHGGIVCNGKSSTLFKPAHVPT